MTLASFGQRFKELRQEKNLTQEKLAEEFFLNKSSISRYEQNKQIPETDLLEKIADYFDVSIDYLVGRSNNKTSKAIELTKQEDFEFDNPEETLRFILGQPAMMNYGGYDLKDMPEEEILEIANDILLTLRISIERRKQKK